MPRALSVYLPRWSINLAIRKRQRQAPVGRRCAPTGPPERAAVLLVISRQGKEVVACHCGRAEAKGVRAGMSLTHARSLLSTWRLWIQPFTPEEDGQQLNRLGRWAFRFSPVVAVDDPDGLLIDIAGCEHLFGGEERLAEKIAASLEQFGFSFRLAVAPTFGCARAVARFGTKRIAFVSDDGIRASLSPLPMTALRIEPEVYVSLAEVGIERIDQLLRVPRDELAARFGSELRGRIDQALGTAPQRIEPLRPHPTFEAVEVFDGPMTRIEIIQAAVDKLLTMVMDQLEKHGRGACQLTFEFRRVDVEPVCLSLSFSYPTRHGAHVRSLLQPKLERVNLGYGVEDILVRATRTQRLDHEQMEFWQPDLPKDRVGMTATLGKLLDQLFDRLGTSAVTRIEPVETYVPEQAFRSIAAGRRTADASNFGWHAHACVGMFGQHPRAWPRERGHATRGNEGAARESGGGSGKPRIYPASRPSHLFEVPEPARVIAIVPDGPPAWLSWRGRGRAVVSSHGPERITLPWWSRSVRPPWRTPGQSISSEIGNTQGGAEHSRRLKPAAQEGVGWPISSEMGDTMRPVESSSTRDYYEVQDAFGHWLWLFRDRESGHWFVHGEWT